MNLQSETGAGCALGAREGRRGFSHLGVELGVSGLERNLLEVKLDTEGDGRHDVLEHRDDS